MLFSEGDAPLLKKWIVKRLENTSDADADVLADYVLALLRHDGDIETVRQLCEAEIPDFLKEDSAVFVQDVFDAIQYKSYLSGAVPPRRRSIPFAPPSGPSAPSYGDLGNGAPMGPHNGSRKRSYNDRGDGDQDRGFQQGGDPSGRSYKQPRRGGSNMGRGNDSFYQGPGRGGFGGGRPPPMNFQSIPQQGFPSMPGMPSPPPGMPAFDPNNPMAAILAMQAMGFPVPGMPVGNTPGMPPFPTPVSPMGRGLSGPPMPQQKRRCRDYDQKGFCAKGNACPFEHGEHSIWVPPAIRPDEYDPAKATLMGGMDVDNQSPGGNPSFRGRGHGRGGMQRGSENRTFNNPNRRGGRAEFSSDRPNYDKSNTTIVVEQIPEEKFSEDVVRGFFSEFGNVVEVSMRPYKRLAVVKFDDWNSAQAAYNSPKVIFDNRFVKVYWFVDTESLPKPPGGGDASSRNGNSTSATPAPARATSEPQIDIEEFTKKQDEIQKAHVEKQKKIQEMEAARKALEKRQEDLLKSQAEEKRKLMEKLAAKRRKSGSPAVLASDVGLVQPESDHEKLKKQLAALEAEAQSLGIDTESQLSDDTPYWMSGRGRGRGRGGYRGRGAFVPRGFRGGYRGRGAAPFAAAGRSFNLDNRPKRVGLIGGDFSDPKTDEALREYLLGIGEYTDIEHNLPENRTTVTFKERYTAEKFISSTTNGEIPGIGKVELAWVANSPLSSTPAKVKVERNGDDDVQMEDGDAMAATSSPARGAVYQKQDQQENVDYDVAADDDYEIY